MITFYEYSESVVSGGHAPARLCCSDRATIMKTITADRVYSIKGNTITEIKNRNGVPGTMHISDEDKVVLKLRAVLI